MLELTKEDILDNKNYFDKAVDMCILEKADSKSNLARAIGESPTSEAFCAVFNFLEKNEFIEVKKIKKGLPHKIFINSPKLTWFLREGLQGKRMVNFLHKGYQFNLLGLKFTKPHWI